MSCGKLDQSCEVYCRKDKLLYLDTKNDSYELIPTPATMKPYVFMILFSGVERSLAGSKFNMLYVYLLFGGIRAESLRAA